MRTPLVAAATLAAMACAGFAGYAVTSHIGEPATNAGGPATTTLVPATAALPATTTTTAAPPEAPTTTTPVRPAPTAPPPPHRDAGDAGKPRGHPRK